MLDVGCRCVPLRWATPCGVARHNPIHSATCCRPPTSHCGGPGRGRALRASAEIPVSRLCWGLGSRGHCGGLSPRHHCGGAAHWVSPPAPLAAHGHRRQVYASRRPVGGSGCWFESVRQCAAVQASMRMAGPEAWDRIMAMGRGQGERGHHGLEPLPSDPIHPYPPGARGC